MENFTPVSALIGGALIGLGALLLYMFSGRIAGISGIASNTLFNRDGRSWRLAFVAGILIGPLLVGLVSSNFNYSTPEFNWQLIVGGLLVGIGTGWGSGCTSGHGICGISRLSVRSIVATLIFMLAGMLIATLLH
ncbi:YeeE/YedE family protein [Rheinheimera aquimaris]|uniref:YeeE/YedE family protein n=1 Tax=Rheinheimera aquimaris TaxID=412437 RepID=A0ABP3NWX1_9GAMM|nr:YeeE/YedE family protein [Rheinheimera aquimaris]MCB5213975.1 YeeE/YedE family protein [Rheinheimera aquimaris]